MGTTRPSRARARSRFSNWPPKRTKYPVGRSMSAAIRRLLERPELAERLGADARQRAAAHFPLAKTVDAHVTLFESLLDPDGVAVNPPVLPT